MCCLTHFDRCFVSMIKCDTSRRCILCFTASLDFLGSFRAILSTLQMLTVSGLSSGASPGLFFGVPDCLKQMLSTFPKWLHIRVADLLSSSQCSAKALSKTLSSSILQETALLSSVIEGSTRRPQLHGGTRPCQILPPISDAQSVCSGCSRCVSRHAAAEPLFRTSACRCEKGPPLSYIERPLCLRSAVHCP